MIPIIQNVKLGFDDECRKKAEQMIERKFTPWPEMMNSSIVMTEILSNAWRAIS